MKLLPERLLLGNTHAIYSSNCWNTLVTVTFQELATAWPRTPSSRSQT